MGNSDLYPVVNGKALQKKYFDWLCDISNPENGFKYTRSYTKLYKKLFETEYVYSNPMDDNRADDGINLRYTFGRSLYLEDCVIYRHLDCRPCSVLEMMVALAIRCEEHIMYDPSKGNRTPEWFEVMVYSLGLMDCHDSNYDERFVDDILINFLNNDFDSDGNGGLFFVPGTDKDMRKIEVWYQLMEYLNSKGDY